MIVDGTDRMLLVEIADLLIGFAQYLPPDEQADLETIRDDLRRLLGDQLPDGLR